MSACAAGRAALIPVIENLSFSVLPGKTLALVGESGCGKSMTALAIMRLLPADFVITGGRILMDGEDVLVAVAETHARAAR